MNPQHMNHYTSTSHRAGHQSGVHNGAANAAASAPAERNNRYDCICIGDETKATSAPVLALAKPAKWVLDLL